MFTELKSKMEEIKQLGWMPYSQNNYGSVGLKLEKLLKVNPENFEIPDYKNIELKTKISRKENKISLFNATPDSYLFEIKRLHNLYGYLDRNNPNYKILNQEVYSNRLTKIKYDIFFKLAVCRETKKIKLLVYNSKQVLIDSQTSWSFELLKTKLERKLQYLCYVEVDKYYSNGINYVKYSNDHYYILKGFDEFINLIERGKIGIVFKIGVFKTGKRMGQIHDHGTSFSIDKQNLALLFEEVLVNESEQGVA